MEQIIISSEYLHAVKAIKQAILDSRYRAARHVNKEVLALNYGIGKFISYKSKYTYKSYHKLITFNIKFTYPTITKTF